MGDETRSTSFSLDPSLAEWTHHLREHTLMYEEHKREHALEQQARDKSEKTIETRFQSVNEFREQLREQSRSFLTRNEYAAAHDPLLIRLSSLETYRAQTEGKDKGSQPYTAVIFSVVSAVLSALAVGAVVIATRTP